MAKLTKEDLNRIREDTGRNMSLRYTHPSVKITVHLGDCGIEKGAREVMHALMTEIARTDRHDIQLFTAGCMDMCSSEPNVTITVGNEPPVVYKKMTPEKAQQVFQGHVLDGEVLADLV